MPLEKNTSNSWIRGKTAFLRTVSVGVKSYGYELFVGLCMALVAVISYNLGIIMSNRQTPLTIRQDANILGAISSGSAGSDTLYIRAKETGERPSPAGTDMRIVVSKTSTSKKYHYSWCPGAKQIKPENQFWFQSEASAQQAGYTLAGNCK